MKVVSMFDANSNIASTVLATGEGGLSGLNKTTRNWKYMYIYYNEYIQTHRTTQIITCNLKIIAGHTCNIHTHTSVSSM